MNKFKKAVSLLLALMLVCSLAAVSASAAGAYDGKTVLLYTGNLRGNVDVYPQIKAAKDLYEKAGAQVILVDAGNFLQGTAVANADRGLTVYNLMDAVGYDAAALGLAEFGYADATTGMVYHGNVTRYHTQAMLQQGTEAIEYNVNRDGTQKATLAAKEPARFAALSANVTAGDSYAFEPSTVITTASGLKVGIYGETDPAVLANVQDDYITAIAEPAALELVADVYVCLSNAPSLPRDVTENTIAVEAPTGGEPVIGAYVIDNATKAVTPETVTLPEGDAALAALVAAAKEAAPEVLATSQVILNGADSVNWISESNLGDLTADALKWYAENYIDGYDKTLPVVAIQNGGNCDQFLYTGDVTAVDLLKALPFSPMGVGVLEVTGAQLLETLEAATCPTERYGALCPGFAQVSGLTYTVNTNKPYDAGEAFGSFFKADSVQRVKILRVGDKAFDPEAKYAVVADNYVLNGNDTYYVFKDAKAAQGAKYVNNGNGVKTRDVVAQYVKSQLNGVVGSAYAKPQGRIAVGTNPFADVREKDWFFDAVLYSTARKYFTGTAADAFSPKSTMTREMFATVLWRIAGEPAAAGQNSFSDVPEGKWYTKGIRWASEQGIINGYESGKFGLGDPITRQQMVAIFWRYNQKPAGDAAVLAGFKDAADIAGYAKDAFAWAVNAKVISGKGDSLLDPTGKALRSHVAQIVLNYALNVQ